MAFDNIISIASGVGIVIGLSIHFMRQRQQGAILGEKILKELRGTDSLALPELVTRVGMRDGFINRGKIINVLNPMVASGQVLQEEPPGTTIKNRLSVLRFRLAQR